MSLATPQLRKFAEQLIAFEGKKRPSGSKTSPAFLVVEKLSPRLAPLMGNAGARALVMRSVALAGIFFPWLKESDVAKDGRVAGPKRPVKNANGKVVTEGGILLVTRFLGLLIAFVGEKLTVVVVREVWPKASLYGPIRKKKAKIKKVKTIARRGSASKDKRRAVKVRIRRRPAGRSGA
jgi:hypothetical protein